MSLLKSVFDERVNNVSLPDNLAVAICGRERGAHLLHLVTEQLPLLSEEPVSAQ